MLKQKTFQMGNKGAKILNEGTSEQTNKSANTIAQELNSERIHFDSPGPPDPDHYLTPLSLFHQLPKPASDGYLFIDSQGIY